MKERDISYEIVRFVSMCFVISVHLLGHLPRNTELRLFMYHAFNLLFFTCNGMFYMLSGKFALQEKCETTRDYFLYYYKKMWGLIFPIIFYMFLRYSHDTGWAFFDSGFMTGFWRNVSSGYSSYEYWYLYTLVGNILVAPFIGKTLQTTSKAGLYIFLFIGLFFNTMRSYLPLFGYEWAWKYPLESWSLYFYLGFCLDRIVNSKKQKAVIYIVGLVSIAISLKQSYGGGVSRLYDLAPTFTCITCMIYILIRTIKIKCSIIKTIIFFVSKHSFGIYMVHMVVLNKVVSIRPMEDSFYIEYLITTATITLVISLVISVIFDLVLVFPVKKVMLGLVKKRIMHTEAN